MYCSLDESVARSTSYDPTLASDDRVPIRARRRSVRSAARVGARVFVFCLLVVDVQGGDAGRAGDGLAVLRALLLVGGDARTLGGDERGRVLLHLHNRAGIVEGLLVLAGSRVGAILQREAVRERRGGREQEQRGGGAGSLGGKGTVDGGTISGDEGSVSAPRDRTYIFAARRRKRCRCSRDRRARRRRSETRATIAAGCARGSETR